MIHAASTVCNAKKKRLKRAIGPVDNLSTWKGNCSLSKTQHKLLYGNILRIIPPCLSLPFFKRMIVRYGL